MYILNTVLVIYLVIESQYLLIVLRILLIRTVKISPPQAIKIGNADINFWLSHEDPARGQDTESNGGVIRHDSKRLM